MTTDDCPGKALLIERLGKESLMQGKLNAEAHALSQEIIQELTKTFCCVEVPILKKQFNWTRLKYESTVIYKKMKVDSFEYSNNQVNVVVRSPISEGICIVTGKEKFSCFVIKAYAGVYNDKENIIKTGKFCDDLRSLGTVEVKEFIDYIITVLATYILEFNKKHKESV